MKNKILLLTILLGFIQFNLSSQTNVSGVISTNTTWSLTNSPYIVVGNVLIEQGISLTIEAGTQIKFDNDKYIKVEGFLLAEGTISNRISFTSNSINPSKSAWGGIVIRPTGGSQFNANKDYLSGSKIVNCDISYADKGIYVFGAGLYVENTVFNENNYGIEIRNTNSILINLCLFESNSTGIYSEYEDYSTDDYVREIKNTFIQNSEFKGNSYAIDLITNQRDFINLNIENNKFENNLTAIDFGGSGYGPKVHSVYISKNELIGNSYDIDRPEFPLQVFENLIINNSNNSIALNSVSVKTDISQNIVIDNTNGFQINGAYTSDHVFRNNYLSGNDYGVKIGNTSSNSYHPTNVLFSNNTFSSYNDETLVEIFFGSNYAFENNNFEYVNDFYIKNLTNSEVTATNNYWDTISSSLIYDYYDDFELGKVIYFPALSTPGTEAPISAPLNITKRSSGDGVIVSWDSNIESDLLGYRIYYNPISEFTFENSIDVGNTTSQTLSGIDILTDIVVTAYDTEVNNVDDVIKGHESWFSERAIVDTSTVTKLNDDRSSVDFEIWPNPAVDEINFRSNNELSQLKLTVLSLEGKMLLQTHKGEYPSKIDISSLSSGIYLIGISDGRKAEYFKIIKR